jgi:3-isopropylmalate/(R)-2-methylmalate dehydratase small subunit
LLAVTPFTIVIGVAAPLPQANLDTDVIMPKQFLKGITRDGLRNGLFHDLRFDESGREREDFILNNSPYRAARFLVVGPNFGCGSSREHAVWGLGQFGIRGIIGTTFASIFQDNCLRNGLLPVELKLEDADLVRRVCSDPKRSTLSVDLSEQTVVLEGDIRIGFSVDSLRRGDLLNGRDAVASTLQFAGEIQIFESNYWAAHPWLKPAAVGR